MGWAYGINQEGREVGYSVEAICDAPGCEAEIDRGLAYVCGDMHDGGDYGCGRYFCGKHLFFGIPGQICESCNSYWEKDHPEEVAADEEEFQARLEHMQTEREADGAHTS